VQLVEKLRKMDRNSRVWKEVKVRGDPYSNLNERFFGHYSALKV
jgi:hypothetical protein